jgi:hypothetical protein
MADEQIASVADAERDRLAQAVRALIAAGVDGDPAPFETLALDLFRWQVAHNAPYREFCTARGVDWQRLADWREIPAFPTDAFREALVTSFPVEQAVMAQLTSGTTANRRGQIFRDEIGRELVLAANRAMTQAWLFPDFAAGQRCRILILAPSPEMAPSMGMAIGMEETRKAFGTPDSRFLLEWHGLDIKGLVAALDEAETSGTPVAMIGSTSAFVFFLQSCKARKLAFRLPAGSRLGDGGGYRGRFGELSQEDFFALAQEVLAIPASHCVNVLGMAETATNYFDDTLRGAVLGRPARRRRYAPPWARVSAVHRETLAPLPPGEVGLLRHYDLVNLPTVIAVQSDNLGYVDADGGFQIVGRAKAEQGRVAAQPSGRVVGPMGDKPIFRFLETYVNFSIRFKMGLVRPRAPKVATPLVPPVCPCDELTENIVAQQRDETR